MMKVLRKAALALAVVMALALVAGSINAAASEYGRLRYSPEATTALKSFDPVPGYRFFAIGFQGEPDGILGVAEGYAFNSNLWKEVVFDSQRGRSALLSFELSVRTCGENAMAYDITDGQGKKVGLWYADSHYPSVRVSDGRELKVFVPSRTRYLKSEEY